MARYRITMRTPFDGKSVGVRFNEGVAEIDGESQSSALAYFERHDGYAVKRLDGDQDDSDAADEEPAGPKAPSRGDSKATWKAYAVSQGVPEADAEAMTRDQLAEKYLGLKEA